ncbi:MAG: DMT family transporter [SAR202 cluster bacterium]|nr:DMT family transporter [SAR202 cluster bacterium]
MALGILLAFLSLFGFSSSDIFARLGLQRLPPALGAFISVLTGFMVTSALALTLYFDDLTALDPRAFLWAFFYGVVTFALARLILYMALSIAGAARTSPIISISPIFATLMAMLFLDERPNWLMGLGILMSVSGMALIVSESRNRPSEELSAD